MEEPPAGSGPAESPRSARLRRRPADVSEDELVELLRQHDYRIGAVAKALGLSRTTVYGLIERSTRICKARDLDAEAIREARRAEPDLAAAARRLGVSRRALQLRMRELGLI